MLDLRTLVPPGRRWVLLLLTVLSALATWTAFPPFELTGLAWVAPALLMLTLSQLTPRQGFLHGWLFGTIFMGGIVSFVAPYGALPWTVLSAVMGLFYGLFGLAAAALRGAPPLWRVPALAGAWFLIEFLRGHVGSLSLTFGDLAYSQEANLPLIQIASVFGHYGVSFLMALLSAGISCLLVAMLPLTWLRPTDALGPLAGSRVDSLRRFNRDAGRVALACFALVIAVYVGGRFVGEAGSKRVRETPSSGGARVAIVQAEGVPAPGGRSSGALMAEYLRLSAEHPADLIVWPETAIGAALNLDPPRQQQLAELARRKHAHLIIGAGEMTGGRVYNSAYFIRPDGAIADLYRKMDLVMFGEYVPGRQRFPFLKRYPIRPFDYTAGPGRALFEMPGLTLSPLICFEGIFPEQTREICRLGAQAVVILTSDAWAKGPNETRVHSAVGPFRAIEARKVVIRSASIGRSAIYDPYGSTLSQVDCHANGVATAYVRPRDGLSTYHYWGDWPLLALSLLALGLGLCRGRRGTFTVAL